MKCKACRSKANPCEARVFIKVGETQIETVADGFKCSSCNQTFVEVAMRIVPIEIAVRDKHTAKQESVEGIKFNAR